MAKKTDFITVKTGIKSMCDYIHINLLNLCLATYDPDKTAYITETGNLTEIEIPDALPDQILHGCLVLYFNTIDYHGDTLSIALWGAKAVQLHEYLTEQGKYF